MENIFLKNSEEIRESLLELFSGPEEKYAVVAFVGKNAINYLSNSANLTVICWPKAGGTNPEGIRSLLNAEVDVKFCKRLHSKIFWCKGKGLIVSSSNLSDNALGDSGLIEFGVRINDTSYDFHANVLNPLSEKLSAVSDKSLDVLDIENNKFNRVNNIIQQGESELRKYPEWYRSKHRQKWKIVSFSEYSTSDEITKNEVFEEFGVSKWKNDNDVNEGVFSAGDIVFQLKTDEEFEITRANGKWIYVDMLTTNHKIIQVGDLKNMSLPFEIDSNFKKAFKEAWSELEWDEILDDKQFTQSKLLELINVYYLKRS